MKRIVLLSGLMALSLFALSAKKASGSSSSDKIKSAVVSGLKFRAVGPALTSGRIADMAVNPDNNNIWYVASASGGVWKTSNAGINFKPIFDAQGSYSIGCVSLDPQNPNVVWVGTGENNNQRSVAYGDGVYKSEDGGKSWKNMGLKNSEHVGMIKVHPKNSNVVFVAAYGPLWSDGGDRGLYKTNDGGLTWSNILPMNDYTGINEIHFDPRDPNVIYATAHQRRRHVWTYISGGPGSAIYKSTDGGSNWKKLENGIPKDDKGRIALAIPPSNPDIIYAMIEGGKDVGGTYKSTNRGASFSKLNDYNTSGNYYVELIPDPVDEDKVFSMDTWCHVTRDGGKTWKKINEKNKHVDNHCMWINPKNTNHYLMGCDGGIYLTYDDNKTWHFFPNLPVTQFYKVAVDNDRPFYNIYGGTQDNFSIGGPARTTNAAGIVNSDWFITKGGDGFESAVDPKEPNIVYAQSQYGWLVRYDKKSGEKVDIKPQPRKDEAAYRWNWDAPLVISPHNNQRLYFCANKVFKSENRGDTWEVISDDLSRQIDRNELSVMGRVWGVDAVSKNRSTTIYGNIVAFDESPRVEGLLYAGTDDGLIHISQDGGANWTKVESFPGVPAKTYVNAISASKHEDNVVYACFNNHKMGDFKPYVMRSNDRGKTWTSISGDLPDRGSVYDVVQDHKSKDLLFAGTEFGIFFSPDAGGSWTQLKGGMPTIAVRDVEIQERENDLVLATFGRGFYVLDDYSPLRTLSKSIMDKKGHLFEIKASWMYVESMPLGLRGKSFQGDQYFTAPNPKVGATFTYYLKGKPKTAKEMRREKEKETAKTGGNVYYPTFDQLRKEDIEEKPLLIFLISDNEGNPVRKMTKTPSTGINRIVWDYRYSTMNPIKLKQASSDNPFAGRDVGHMAVPARYKVQMFLYHRGKIDTLSGSQEFDVSPLDNMTLPAPDEEELLAFKKKVKDLQREVSFANKKRAGFEERLKYVRQAYLDFESADITYLEKAFEIKQQLQSISIKLNGDRAIARREFETPPSVNFRIGLVVGGLWNHRQKPTDTQKMNIKIASEELEILNNELVEVALSLKTLEKNLDEIGAPYTPGR